MGWELVWECSREHERAFSPLLISDSLCSGAVFICRLLSRFFLSPSTLFCIMPSQGRSRTQYGCSDFTIAKLFNCLSAGSCWTLLPPWLFITWYSTTLITSSEKFSLTCLLVGWMKCPSNYFPEFHVHLGFIVSYWWRRSEEVPRARTQKEPRKSGQTGK